MPSNVLIDISVIQ